LALFVGLTHSFFFLSAFSFVCGALAAAAAHNPHKKKEEKRMARSPSPAEQQLISFTGLFLGAAPTPQKKQNNQFFPFSKRRIELFLLSFAVGGVNLYFFQLTHSQQSTIRS